MSSSDETSTYECVHCGARSIGLTESWRHTDKFHPETIRSATAPWEVEVGTRVRAVYPNASWGSGTVVDADPNRRGRNPDTGRMRGEKPLKVERDSDGSIGWFHYSQVAILEEVVEA